MATLLSPELRPAHPSFGFFVEKSEEKTSDASASSSSISASCWGVCWRSVDGGGTGRGAGGATPADSELGSVMVISKLRDPFGLVCG